MAENVSFLEENSKFWLMIQVMAVKKRIEDLQGKDTFPCTQQLLIYKGKVLKDETTMDQNSVTDNSFLVVMLTKVPRWILFKWLECLCYISEFKGKYL
jgi:hypothetical protein